jgi:hypothetical protein
MKKWIIVCLIVAILAVFTSGASASTIPVNVSPGLILQFSGQSAIGNDLFTSFGANFDDHLALGLEYATPSNYFIASVRYSFVKNFAAALSYSTSNPIAWNADFRMKYDFDESLALVGVAGFDGTYLNGTGQAEYWFSEQLAGNIGFGYNQSISSLILGGEFLMDRIDMGLNCRFPVSNSGQSQVELFVAYKF